ncbi:MAG: aldehyde dehydrogenase family protein [Methanoregula sp.]
MLMRIGGTETASLDEAWMEIKNPATGETIDRVPAGRAEDAARAVDAAQAAGEAWKKKSLRERGMILFHAAEKVREQHKDLARLLTMEQGKPLRESVDEVRGFANILEFYAGISAHQSGQFLRLGSSGDGIVVREPLGVCGAIIPWNMPVLIMGWKTGPALLAGNTLVLKPASSTPLTSLRLAKILDESGLPPGVLNIITGRGEEAGEGLVCHPDVRKLSFTGSCATGMKIRELASHHLMELTLELGGSDPMIVMNDANIERAVEGAVRGRFYNAGQTCTAVKRLYVHEAVADVFIRKLKEQIGTLNVGNGLGPRIDMGPLNSSSQREIISRAVEDARENNLGKIITGGCALKGMAYEQGNFYRPTLVTDVVAGSGLVTEEIFGPVLPVMTVPNLETAIREANSTRFGLGASIWTSNMHTAKKAFDEIHAGIVWVNRHLTIPPEIPFGGVGSSGIGRENGQDALDSYTQVRSLVLGW